MKSHLLSVALLLMSVEALAQPDVLRQKHFNLKKNVALEGYDAVSYFSGKPMEGSDEITMQHKGVLYYFASESNHNKFKSNPEKYEPAYGGWCAFAMGETGEKVKVDPETFKIIDGRLYLFYNFWANNTLEDWNKREAKLKEQADKNWKKTVQ